MLLTSKFIFKLFSQKSFEDVEVWLKDLKTYSNPDIKVFLIGNKTDMEEKYNNIIYHKIADRFQKVMLKELQKIII